MAPRAVVVAFAAHAACYAPAIHPGSPCDDSHPCPVELACSPATMTCEPTSSDAGAGPGDGNGDGPAGAFCYGGGLVLACFASAPTGDLELTGAIDTDTDPRCATLAGACAIAADRIAVQAVTVTGSRPLVIVGVSGVQVSATLDASSHRSPASVGPAANPAACATTTPSQVTTYGGAGGSFTTRGGRAGAETGGSMDPALPGPIAAADSLRGGCPGFAGGGGLMDLVGTGGPGGSGGGAVDLISIAEIDVTGTIDASGAGGAGGGSNLELAGGGGGGGAGGLIGLDAPLIIVAGQVFANGGGGGAAGDTKEPGVPGADPSSASSPAAGGSLTGATGGTGGSGSVGSGAGGDGTDGVSGGGGGGGAGAVRVFPPRDLAGKISPPPS
jgi:hypothetical protein